MDITYENNGIVFNLRVAIVVRNENKILIQKDSRVNHLTLPGGRCMLGEDTTVTCKREFREETGISITFKENLGVIENFFTSSFSGKNYHEILIVNEVVFDNINDYSKVIKSVEDKNNNYITYIWMDLNDLKTKNFKPQVILDMIDGKLNHFIQKDKKNL